MLILKSDTLTGILDDKNLIAYFGNEQIRLPRNACIEPGDSVKIKNREFIAVNPDPVFFSEISGRNTQVILPFDASYIIYAAGISPGKMVLEAGVGTGSLSYGILKAVGVEGGLTSMDISENNIALSREKIAGLIPVDNWDTHTGDIRTSALDRKFDVAILDIPDPWNAVENVRKYMKPGSFLVTYSPNFNQAEKNVVAMKNYRFYVLETVELIKRNIIVRENATRPDNNIIDHTAFITFAIRKSGI
ncbi:methyltransferase domain-containing protein [Ferroplasma sp.]|uniref:tRNA (adenine-N1)-methyltransferase n=1 Tax=Ferroplasma sp. TaxID=2591003 RepID=UPI002601C735|nr:methyltransferase domain-containing protein [Ferroplasma sp.]